MEYVQLFKDFIVQNPAFCFFSFLILISALYVVTLRNIFHCAIFLILALFGVAGIYVLLEAEFLAAVQVLIYVGAVSVLMIFAIMLTSHYQSIRREQSNEQTSIGIVVSFFFMGLVMLSLAPRSINGEINTVWRVVEGAMPENNTLAIGKLLMTQFVLPFEVVSIVLLAAMIGAIVLARREQI